MTLPIPGRFAPLWCVALFACGALIGTRAQDMTSAHAIPPKPIAEIRPSSLAQAVEAAWQRSHAFQEADAHLRQTEAQLPAVSSSWAAPPALELSRRQERWRTGGGNATETEAGLALPLWVPGQRHARQVALQADSQWAQAGLLAGRHQVAGQVREAAWHVAYTQAQHDILDTQTQLLESLARDVQRRVAAGELARTDAMAAQAEVLAAQIQQVEASQTLAQARLQWHLLTGLVHIPDTLEETSHTTETAAGIHPELQYARLAVDHAQREWEAVDKDTRDPPELLLKMRRDTGGPNGGSQHSVGIGVRIPFGTEGRNAPKQALARSTLQRRQALVRQTQARLEAEQQAARHVVYAAQQQWKASQQQNQLLHERAQLLQRAFDAGETALPELLRALSAAAQAHAALARQQAAIGLAQARLQQTLGTLP